MHRPPAKRAQDEQVQGSLQEIEPFVGREFGCHGWKVYHAIGRQSTRRRSSKNVSWPDEPFLQGGRKMFHVKHFAANLLILKSGYEGIGQATRSVICVNRLDSTRCGGPGLRGRQPWPAALSSFFPALRYGPACSSAGRSHGPAGRRRWFPCRLALLSVCGSGHPSLRSARATVTVAGGTRPDLSRAEVMLRPGYIGEASGKSWAISRDRRRPIRGFSGN